MAHQSTDDIGAILEMQIGLQWRRQITSAAGLFVRGGYEQQLWFGAGTFFRGERTPGDGILDIQPDDHDAAFMGFGLTVGLEM
jgi:hypothetical protein